MKKFKFLSKDKISQLPKSTGVYVFKNGREFLYIGKAANIKERVKNHFQQPIYRDGLFLNKVKKIGFIKTDSEIEALLLESKLIKKYQPRFNVIWKDDKNYFYVGVAKEDFPRVFITHQPQNLKPKTYNLKPVFMGPFVDGKALKQTLRILRKVLPYRSCKNLPKRPCLWYQLDRCPAPCLSKSNLGTQLNSWKTKMKKECQRNANNLIKVLKGGRKHVLKDLKKEMKRAAKEESFETAAKIRNQIFALEKVLAHSKILDLESLYPDWKEVEKELKKILKTKCKISRIEAYDISNIQGKLATGSMVTFIGGKPDKNFYRKFKVKIAGKPNDIAMIKEVLKRRFLHPEWPYPDLILIDGGKAQLNAAKSIIKESKLKIPVGAIAKKRNELYLESRKKPLLLKKLSREIFNLILQLRDEAHRFAIKYHKSLRRIDLLSKS